MPRTARIVIPGSWYHITSRGIERRAIFRDDRDRRHFLELLAELTSRFRLRLHAYVLMDNHYHLLAQLPEPNLSRAIQWLNLSHTAWFNRRHRRVGYLFQGRFKSIIVDPVAWGFSLSAYIHLNPARLTRLRLSKADVARARRNRVEDPGKAIIRQRLLCLKTYPWSSYTAYVYPERAPKWLDARTVLNLSGGRAAQRHSHYREYVENKLRQGQEPSPWENLHAQSILGDQDFIDTICDATSGNTGQAEQPRRDKTIAPEDVIKAIERERGERWADFRDRHGDTVRDLFLAMARRATNLTLTELSKIAGLKGPAQVSLAIKRFEARIGSNPTHREAASAVAKRLNLNYDGE